MAELKHLCLFKCMRTRVYVRKVLCGVLYSEVHNLGHNNQIQKMIILALGLKYHIVLGWALRRPDEHGSP